MSLLLCFLGLQGVLGYQRFASSHQRIQCPARAIDEIVDLGDGRHATGHETSPLRLMQSSAIYLSKIRYDGGVLNYLR